MVDEYIERVITRAKTCECTKASREVLGQVLSDADTAFGMDFEKLLASDKWVFAHDIVGLLCHADYHGGFGGFVPVCRKGAVA